MSELLHAILTYTKAMIFYLDQQLTPENCLFLVGVLACILAWLKLTSPRKKKNITQTITASPADFTAIAGENVFVTQLDLARAYIEMGDKKLALEILEPVLQSSHVNQQQDAKKLIELACALP